jgi:hypothetical protein
MESVGFEPYNCTADEIVLGGEPVENVIEYHAESSERNRVEESRLTARIFDQRREDLGVGRFGRLVPVLFERLEVPMPEGLPQAIELRRSESFPVEYGSVTLTRDDSYNRGHGLVLSIVPEAEGSDAA